MGGPLDGHIGPPDSHLRSLDGTCSLWIVQAFVWQFEASE